MRRIGLALVLLLCLGAAPSESPSSRLTPARRAQLLHRWAVEAIDQGTPESRALAVRHLAAAIALEPENSDHWLLLGRVRVIGEYDRASRDCFRRALTLDPHSLTAALDLAAAWKREWMRTLDTLALRNALGVLDTTAALHPFASEPWLRLVPLRYEVKDYGGAARAAAQAMARRPRRPEATLAGAYVAFHEGEIERADSLFRSAIPRLDPALTALFQDPSRTLGSAGPPHGWKGLDPDPTTPENELELEYWSRLAHAFLLFYDPDRTGTDARFQFYVQYGAPRTTAQNPIGAPLYFRTFASSSAPSQGSISDVGGNPGRIPVDFPTPVQVWQYPELGMRLVLQDRSLHGRFQPQANMDVDPAARPDPTLLKGADLLSFGDGVAVFHRLPPREQRIKTHGIIARFAGERSPRLMAQVEVAGSPADSLLARWVVTDRSGRPITRGAQVLALDACDPAERRTSQFTADIPPGDYQVTVSVRGAAGRRGMFQAPAEVEPVGPGLGLSDLVLACGDPSLLVGGGSARFDANVDGSFRGSRSIAGYLEIYRLALGKDGLAHFGYLCNVRRAIVVEKRGRARAHEERAVLVSTARDERHVGTMRRQFVVVPVQALPPGRYELEVVVTD